MMTEKALEDPGPPLILTLTTTSTGQSNLQYTVDPTVAVSILRELADSIESEISA